MSRCRHYIPIASHLDAVWNAILCKEEGALVRETGASVDDVEGVDCLALPRDVVRVWDVGGGGGAGVCGGKDADRVDGGVGYVDGEAVRGEGDAVGGDEVVGEQLHEPGAGDEAVDGGFQLRESGVVETGEVDGVPWVCVSEDAGCRTEMAERVVGGCNVRWGCVAYSRR